MQENRKHILIICPDSRHFIQDYIYNVLEKNKYKISFLTVCADLTDATWTNNEVTVYNIKKDKTESRIKTLICSFFRFCKIRREIGTTDIIHYHYVDYRFTHLAFCFFKNRSRKSVVTFWGGDLLTVDDHKIAGFKKLYKQASYINLMSKEMYDVFQNKTGCKYKDKSIVLDFGNSTIEGIDALFSNEFCEKAKVNRGFPLDKIIIHIGYNARREQQHIKIIKVIGNLPEELRNKIYAVIPFGYGCTDGKYKSEITNELESLQIPYCICEEYLDKEKVIAFRSTADIFFYAQETDALSSSVLEYLCAESIFLKPVWLDYTELSNEGVVFKEYTDFKNAKDILIDILSNYDNYSGKLSNNRSTIIKLKSWSGLKEKWLEMYE